MKTISPAAMRRIILRHSKRANVGHIGSCLCVVEIIAALYSDILRIPTPSAPDRDRFILSKGHAALALYAALVLKGTLPEDALNSFCGDGSLLGVHPEAALTGVDFSTGSLGQGLSIAVGSALAARMQGSSRGAFCLISDGECNEGSVWEAAMFAAHHQLGNLKAVIDLNGQQAMGLTRDVIDISNTAERWQAFGWRTSEVDGHSIEDLTRVLSEPTPATGAPHLIIARTTFGKGVWYMEQGVPLTQERLPVSKINWHYLPMSDAEYEIAMAGLRAD
jgi:transketolase